MEKYFIKLINGEKFELTKEEFGIWSNNKCGDYIVVNSVNNNPIYIFKDKILLGFILQNEDNFKNKKGRN